MESKRNFHFLISQFLVPPLHLGIACGKGCLYFINKWSGYFLLPWRENPSSLLTTGFGNIKSDGLSGKSKSEYLTVFETDKNGTQKWVLQLPIFQETNWAKSSWTFFCSGKYFPFLIEGGRPTGRTLLCDPTFCLLSRIGWAGGGA